MSLFKRIFGFGKPEPVASVESEKVIAINEQPVTPPLAAPKIEKQPVAILKAPEESVPAKVAPVKKATPAVKKKPVNKPVAKK
jgi:hypothetical protein